MTQIVYPDQTITYTYDAPCPYGVGRLCSVSYKDGWTSYEYDAQGRVTKKTQSTSLGWTTDTRSILYGYTNGRLTSVTYPDAGSHPPFVSVPALTVHYSYDVAGRVGAVSVTESGTTKSVLSDVLYDADGAVLGWTWANGTHEVRDYDNDGRTTLVDSAGAALYDYDDANRLLTISPLSDSPVSPWFFDYDNLDRLTSATGPYPFSEGFTYDRNGNRKTQTGYPAGTYAYSMSGTQLLSNRLQSVSAGTNRSYTYDAMGNVTWDGQYHYGYDGAGRRTSAGSTNYRYNALGQRTLKTTPFNMVEMYDEAGHPLMSCTVSYEAGCSEYLSQVYIWLGDIPVQVYLMTGQTDWEGLVSDTHFVPFNVHTDHLNTPRRLTDASDVTNTLRWFWNSDPFGDGSENSSPQGDPWAFPLYMDLRFPGQMFDQETYRHYNYFRDYDPYTGRYLESDPIGLEGGINTYAYVGSEPVDRIDPLGLEYGAAYRAELRSMGWKFQGPLVITEVPADQKKVICKAIQQCQGDRNCVFNTINAARRNTPYPGGPVDPRTWNDPTLRNAENFATALAPDSLPYGYASDTQLGIESYQYLVKPYLYPVLGKRTTPVSDDAFRSGMAGHYWRDKTRAELLKWCNDCASK